MWLPFMKIGAHNRANVGFLCSLLKTIQLLESNKPFHMRHIDPLSHHHIHTLDILQRQIDQQGIYHHYSLLQFSNINYYLLQLLQ